MSLPSGIPALPMFNKAYQVSRRALPKDRRISHVSASAFPMRPDSLPAFAVARQYLVQPRMVWDSQVVNGRAASAT